MATIGRAEVMNATPEEFLQAIAKNRDEHPHMPGNTHIYTLEQYTSMSYRLLTRSKKAGVAVTQEGELVNLFNNSGRAGLGVELVRAAVLRGATDLNCFDGFLAGYYTALGWRIIRREPNWTPGEPDVVYMVYQGFS